MKTFKTEKGTELPLLNLKGKDYLQAAYRLVWFREVHPLWGIETELKLDDEGALARAMIRTEDARVIAVAHKYESTKDFPDFIEKAETGAISRALAMIGFGTQFTAEFDEGHRLADSPVITKETIRSAIELFDPVVMSVETPTTTATCSCGSPFKWSARKQVFYCPNFKEPGEHAKPFKA